MVQDDLEKFSAETTANPELFSEPMSAAQTAIAAQLQMGDVTDRKATSAYRAMIVYVRTVLTFFTQPHQQRITNRKKAAGDLHQNDARVRIPLILANVPVGEEMAMLSSEDFFFCISTYMCNSRRAASMQGNSKKTHMDDVVRVYRKYLERTPSRLNKANFKWKQKCAGAWKVMQKDTLNRADRGEEREQR